LLKETYSNVYHTEFFSDDAPIRDFANYLITDIELYIIANTDNQADIKNVFHKMAIIKLYFCLIKFNLRTISSGSVKLIGCLIG